MLHYLHAQTQEWVERWLNPRIGGVVVAPFQGVTVGLKPREEKQDFATVAMGMDHHARSFLCNTNAGSVVWVTIAQH